MKINPAASIYRPQPVKRDKPGLRELPLDVPEPEIREQEIEDAIFGAKARKECFTWHTHAQYVG